MKRSVGALHNEAKKVQQQQLEISFYTADVTSEERGGLCHLVDKLKHCSGNQSGEQTKNIS